MPSLSTTCSTPSSERKPLTVYHTVTDRVRIGRPLAVSDILPLVMVLRLSFLLRQSLVFNQNRMEGRSGYMRCTEIP